MMSRIQLSAVLITALALASCRKEEPIVETKPPRSVKYAVLEQQGLPRTLEYPGQVRSSKESWMAFEVAGRINEPVVKEGQVVKKGDVLARLDDRDYQAELEAAEAEHEAAESVEARMRPLHDKRAVSKQELDLAERDLRTATARLNRAKKAVEDTRLVAEFDGKVARVMVEDYANVAAKQNILILQDPDSLEIVIDVPESVMSIPMPGATPKERVANARPEVLLSTHPGKSFPAELSEAAEQADPYTRTYKVTLSFFPEDTTFIRPGMTGRVRATVPAFDLLDSEGFIVPIQATVSDESGRAHLWRIKKDDGIVEPVPVKLGAMGADTVAVTGDLEPGDLIATSGVHRVHSGDKVRLWKPH